MAVTLAACGGGGGGGGFSSGSLGDGTNGNGSKNKFHHDAEMGKWGSSNATGGGSFGCINDIYINGNPSLDVTGYTFNGTTYSDLKDFAKAIFEIGTTEDVFYVNFNVNGESAPKTARIRANGAANPGDDLTIDYQYKATYTIQTATATSATPQEAFYYKRDGLNLNLPILSDSDYAEPDGDGIEYHANKWLVQGQTVSGGNVLIHVFGDVAIGDITPTVDRTYGFKNSGELVVNSTGTVAVNNSGRSSITKIELPTSGSVALDLSQVTNLAIANNGATLEKQIESLPEEYLEEVSRYIQLLQYKIAALEQQKKKNNPTE